MTNGCGPNWLPKKVKDLLFNWFYESPCDDHDKAYRKGGNELDRWRADFVFLRSMLLNLFNIHPIAFPIAAVQALVFYLLVMLFGWTRFTYTD